MKEVGRILIKTETDSYVHFDTGKNNYTLCGLETGGDSFLEIDEGKPTTRKVNCPDCIGIVKFCSRIKTTDYNP